MRCAPLPAVLGLLATGLLSAAAAEFPEVADLPSRPELPDPLVLFSGQPVTSPEQWNSQRRPELKALFPDAPFIPRTGQINAWDNEDFVKAVKQTGKKQLVIAGVVTDVCVAFPTLSALREGYQVFVVADASGTFNKSVRDAALMRMQQAGAVTTNWFAVACELQRDWRRDMEGLATLLGSYLPAYKNLMTAFSVVSKK